MFIKTTDNVKIAYDWLPTEEPVGYLILVHMMPATKESWGDFAAEAQKLGYNSIAIDLRGHGESDGGPNGYQDFDDTDHQKSILDLQAAVDYLRSLGVSGDKTYFVGASIGANLSLQFLAENHNFKKAVLLSAGLNYRGVDAESLVGKLIDGQSIMLVAARDDDRAGGNCVAMNERLAELIPPAIKKELVFYEGGGHGTDILRKHPELTKVIFDFLAL